MLPLQSIQISVDFTFEKEPVCISVTIIVIDDQQKYIKWRNIKCTVMFLLTLACICCTYASDIPESNLSICVVYLVVILGEVLVCKTGACPFVVIDTIFPSQSCFYCVDFSIDMFCIFHCVSVLVYIHSCTGIQLLWALPPDPHWTPLGTSII